MATTTTTIAFMTNFPSHSRHPTQGRLFIQNSIRTTVPGSVLRTLSYSDHEFHFNPLLEFGSPTNASSYMSGVMAAVEHRAGPEIADRIAFFGFREVSVRGWASGLSLRVILETNHVLGGQSQRSEESRGDNDDSLNDISNSPEEMEDLFRSFDSSVSLGGMSERELCMLRREEFSGDNEEGECCICLEGFMEGAVITPLAPCSHRFHHICILKWLRKNPTCPICRRRSTVPV
nr:Zinc finger, RING/FYVE/PHD-type [Ipomoea batatas]